MIFEPMGELHFDDVSAAWRTGRAATCGGRPGLARRAGGAWPTGAGAWRAGSTARLCLPCAAGHAHGKGPCLPCAEGQAHGKHFFSFQFIFSFSLPTV